MTNQNTKIAHHGVFKIDRQFGNVGLEFIDL